MPTRHDAGKSGPGAARRPEQIGVLPIVGDKDFAVGRHDFRRRDVQAPRAPGEGIPAQAPIQQIAAQSHRGAVSHGKGEALCRETALQFASHHTGLDDRPAVVGIDLDLPKSRQIKEQPALTQHRAVVVVSAAAHPDLESVLPGKTHRSADVRGVTRSHDRVRKSTGLARIPHHRQPLCLVVALTVKMERPADSTAQLAPVGVGNAVRSDSHRRRA